MPLENMPGLGAVHPYAALAAATGNFPPDLQLEAADCWDLYSVMASVAQRIEQPEVFKEVSKLRPEIFFKSTPYIKIVDVIRYESALRTTIEKWIALPIYKDVLNVVTSTLGKEIEKQMTDMEECSVQRLGISKVHAILAR
jgi:hypothetical protein